jgi:predicted alpha/beta-fold hydrolase
VLLKYLGERDRTPLAAAAAISVPYDLAAGLAKLESGASRLYHGYLLRKLRRKVRAKAAALRSLIDVPALLRVRSLRTFDDLATAPLHGFEDAEDYYRQSSSKQFLPAIRTPAVLIHALDDPFLPAAAVPWREVEENSHLEAAFVAHGGHVGFVHGPPYRPRYWAERTAAGFLASTLRRS